MKTQSFLRTQHLVTVAMFFAFVLPGCAIHAWRVSPTDVSEEAIASYAQEPGAVIYYNVPAVFEKPLSRDTADSLERVQSAQLFTELLGNELTKNPTFDKAILTSVVPERGYYVSVDVTHVPHLTTESALKIIMCSVTMMIIPCYIDDAVECRISYHLFKDGNDLKTYYWMVQQKSLTWNLLLLAIPFIDSWTRPPWMVPKEQAFAETSKKFWQDARADGYF
ncbi:MAG: hypothetical protein GDA68_14845 [Nitrospira sp. CR2.1]|nr:hypothetical protein [Nitrospira sp. CR2.1]